MAKSSREEDIVDILRHLVDSEIPRIQRTLRSLQPVQGHVLGDGTVDVGADVVTVNKNGTGDYSVNFVSPFDEAPLVQLTVAEGTVGALQARLHSTEDTTETGFRVITFNTTSGAVADSAFNFEAKRA